MTGPPVGIEKGQLVCPMCWSLCLVRSEDGMRRTQWVWWCGCGWTSEAHPSPGKTPVLLQRFEGWRRLNSWSA